MLQKRRLGRLRVALRVALAGVLALATLPMVVATVLPIPLPILLQLPPAARHLPALTLLICGVWAVWWSTRRR